jgi:PEP-CTERM/exosortase A-associated glycosyltransferase
MRILHVLDHSIPLQSGYSFRTLAILKEQRALGWETFHLTSAKHHLPFVPEEEVDGWRFFRTAPANGVLMGLPGLREIDLMGELTHRLEQVVKRVKPHLLHAHSPVLNAIPALRVGRRLGIPVIYEVRAFWEDAAVDHGTSRPQGLRYRLTRAIETYALRHADAVVTICEGLRGDIIGRGVPQAKITVVPNAVDCAHFSTGVQPDPALLQSLGLEGAQVLAFIGSFYAYEGLQLLLHAFTRILREAPHARLLLVGGGYEEAELHKLAQTPELAGKVVFTGRVPQEQIKRYYDLASVLVYPRLPMRLTDLVTPLKPLEAMAQGRLVLASDVGGHRELIRHGETGILFKSGDARDLTAKALDLIANPSGSARISRQARRFVEAERNWPGSVAHYRDVYARLVPGSV